MQEIQKNEENPASKTLGMIEKTENAKPVHDPNAVTKEQSVDYIVHQFQTVGVDAHNPKIDRRFRIALSQYYSDYMKLIDGTYLFNDIDDTNKRKRPTQKAALKRREQTKRG